VTAISYDEDRSGQFGDSDKVTTFRSYRGEAGFYVTLDLVAAPTGSDYRLWPSGRVIDRGARVVYSAQGTWTLSSLKAKTDGTRRITDASAARVESAVRSQVGIALIDPVTVEGDRSHVSGLSYNVNRLNDFLNTNTIQSSLAVVGRPAVEQFITQVGFARSL